MPATIKTIHGNHVCTHAVSSLCMPDCDTFVDHNDSSALQLLDDWFGISPSSFNNLHAFINDHLHDSFVIWRNTHGEQSDVDTKRFVCQRLAFLDLIPQCLLPARRLGNCECSDDTKATCVGNCCCHL